MPATRISAAQPIRCCDVSLDPTASFTCLQRKAEFTVIAFLPRTSLTSSRNRAKRSKLAISASLGVLSNSR